MDDRIRNGIRFYHANGDLEVLTLYDVEAKYYQKGYMVIVKEVAQSTIEAICNTFKWAPHYYFITGFTYKESNRSHLFSIVNLGEKKLNTIIYDENISGYKIFFDRGH